MHSVPVRQGIKSGRSKLSRLLSEKHSSYVKGYNPSNLIKKSDVVLSVQWSPPENNTVQEVRFDNRRVDPAHDPWAKTPFDFDRWVLHSKFHESTYELRINDSLLISAVINHQHFFEFLLYIAIVSSNHCKVLMYIDTESNSFKYC